MTQQELTDAQWEQIRPLLPAQKPHIRRPKNDHRMVVSGIIWILRTGAPWKDLPERFGKTKTVSSRFYRWRRAGIWTRVLERLQQLGDRDGRLDWADHFVDATVVRARQHAAGAKKGMQRGKHEGVAVVDSAQRSMCVWSVVVRSSRSLRHRDNNTSKRSWSNCSIAGRSSARNRDARAYVPHGLGGTKGTVAAKPGNISSGDGSKR